MTLFRRNSDSTDFETARQKLVDQLVSRDRISREETIEALRTVPRHKFVPASSRDQAYVDSPLPIGNGQTISAPHMVGIMCDLLEVTPGDRVLEIGTGCGYHAAVTAEIVGDEHVYSVEYIPELATRAEQQLTDLGYDINLRQTDGWTGWPNAAPFDAAYLTCAADTVPDSILSQLKPGGRMVAPIGTGRQTLYRYFRREDGYERENHGGVRFVQMQRSEN